MQLLRDGVGAERLGLTPCDPSYPTSPLQTEATRGRVDLNITITLSFVSHIDKHLHTPISSDMLGVLTIALVSITALATSTLPAASETVEGLAVHRLSMRQINTGDIPAACQNACKDFSADFLVRQLDCTFPYQILTLI